MNPPTKLILIFLSSIPSFAETGTPKLTETDASIAAAFARTEAQAMRIIEHITSYSDLNGWDPYSRYPVYTENELFDDSTTWADGEYTFSTKSPGGTGWADGAWPGLLWQLFKMEPDPEKRNYWEAQARLWSAAMLQSRRGDMMFAYLLPTQIWLEEAATTEEADELKNWILDGSLSMLEPFRVEKNKGYGTWLSTVGPFDGAYGYWRKADSDGQSHFHIFIDHMVTTELMLAGADLLVPVDPETAQKLRRYAISQIKTVTAFSGANRDVFTPVSDEYDVPAFSGSWQRGYFDFDPLDPQASAPYLWSEAKQGWTSWSTWARGHAWLSYACAVTYAKTGDPSLIPATAEVLDYFIDNLPANQIGKATYADDLYVPRWDFDYASFIDPETRFDSSAAAIFLAGLVRFVDALPADYPKLEKYTTAMLGMFSSLTSPEFLTQEGEVEMSILKQGSYHDSAAFVSSKIINNGLIWGDYFFVQALADYMDWRKTEPWKPAIRILHVENGIEIQVLNSLSIQEYTLESSSDTSIWNSAAEPQNGNGKAISWNIEINEETPATYFRVSTVFK